MNKNIDELVEKEINDDNDNDDDDEHGEENEVIKPEVLGAVFEQEIEGVIDINHFNWIIVLNIVSNKLTIAISIKPYKSLIINNKLIIS